MKDFLAHTVFDLTEKSDDKVSKVVAKIVHYLNCAVISVWLSEVVKLGYNGEDVSYKSILNFIFSFQLVIPMFLFLFVFIVFGISTEIAVWLLVRLIRKRADAHYFEGVSMMDYLIKLNIVTKELKTGSDFIRQRKKILKHRKFIMGSIYWAEYSFKVFLSTTVVYNVIVIEKFPTLFYGWINLGIIILLLLSYVFTTLFAYKKQALKRVAKILKKAGKTQDSLGSALN